MMTLNATLIMDKRRMLKPLLISIVAIQETALAWGVVEEILEQREQACGKRDDAIGNRGFAGLRHALICIVVQ